MINRLDDDNSLKMLESIADKYDLLLSDNLIDFASEVWSYAYKANVEKKLTYHEPTEADHEAT